MKGLRSDPWLQAFAAVAVLAAAFLAYDFMRKTAASVETAASAAVAAPAAAADRLASDAMAEAVRVAQQNAAASGVVTPPPSLPSNATVGPAPQAAPDPALTAPKPAPAPTLTVTPPPPQPGFSPTNPFGGVFGPSAQLGQAARAPRHLGRPKKPGEWVVDGAGNPDADTQVLAEALYSAVDGDVITLMRGNYNESGLVTSKSVKVRGGAKRPEDVRIILEADPTWHVTGGRLELENLRVEKRPNPAGGENNGAALSVQNGSARLRDVELAVTGITGAALRVGEGGSVIMERGLLQGTHADALLRGRASARLKRVRLRHDISPIIAWNGAKTYLESCELRIAKRGSLKVYENGSISGGAPPSTRREQPDRAADALAFGSPNSAPSLNAQADASDPLSALYQIIPMPGGRAQQPGAAPTGSRFRKDIFRPGRRAGDISQ